MVKTSEKKRVHKKQANCFSVYVNRDQRTGNECCCVFFSTSCYENNSIEVHIPTTAPRKRAAQHGNYQKGLITMERQLNTKERKGPHTQGLIPLSSRHRGFRFGRATAVLYRLLCPAAPYPTKNSLMLAPSGNFITRYSNLTLPDRQLLEGMQCLPVLRPSSNCR